MQNQPKPNQQAPHSKVVELPIPGHSSELERTALACMLLDSKLCVIGSADLTPEDFYVGAHRAIFNIFLHQIEETGFDLNAPLVGEEMRRAGVKLDGEHSVMRLHELIGHIGSAEGTYRKLTDLTKQRASMQAATQLSQAAKSGDSDAVVALSQNLIDLHSTPRVKLTPFEQMDQQFQEAVAGTRYLVPLPWPMLSQGCNALLPGTVTVLCGAAGATKSMILVQALRHWNQIGEKAVAMMLEDGSAYHLRRALAQVAKFASVLSDTWCKQNPKRLEEIRQDSQGIMKSLEHCIEDIPDHARATPDWLIGWVNRKALEGNRVICIDPITLMEVTNRFQDDHSRFMFTVKRIIQKHGASLVLVTHPRKRPAGGKPSPMTMDDIANNSAYARFSQTILWLSAYKPEERQISSSMGVISCHLNRTITAFKTRNAEDRRVEYGMYFDGGTLELHERGEIAED